MTSLVAPVTSNVATLTIDGRTWELPIVEGSEGERAIDVSTLRSDTGLNYARPGIREHRQHTQRDHLHRRRAGHPPLSRLPDRGVGRAEQFPRDHLPAPLRRPAECGSARQLRGADHQPHAAARGHPAHVPGVPSGGTPDGHECGRGRRALDVLRGLAGPARPGAGGDLHLPADREAADDLRSRLQVRDGAPLQLPAQRSQLRRETCST